MLANCDCSWENILAVVTDNEPTMNKFGDLIDETEWFGCIDPLIQLVTKPVFDGEGIAACDGFFVPRALIGLGLNNQSQRLETIIL